MKNQIIQGDALEILKTLPDKCVNMLMTSPPYWALRDYGSDVENIFDEVCLKCKKPFTKFKSESCDCERYTYCEHEFELKEVQAGTEHWNQGGKVIPYEERKIHNEKIMQTGFCQKCGAWKGQLGLEPTFDLYIKHLCDIFDEVKRVLRDDGTIWINLGDTYASSPAGNKEIKHEGDGVYGRLMERHTQGGTTEVTPKPKDYGRVQNKSLVMIPERFAIEMINRGWILRNKVIWHKRNCMPSSAKDRFTIEWEYLYFFSKKKKYYFETQYEKWTDEREHDIKRAIEKHEGYKNAKWSKEVGEAMPYSKTVGDPTKGRIKRCVWTINPKPFSDYICDSCGYYGKAKSIKEKKGYFGGEDVEERICPNCREKIDISHFAIYPEELCETPIKAGCPEFVCVKCGNPKEAIFEPSEEYAKNLRNQGKGWSSERRKQAIKIGHAMTEAKKHISSEYIHKGYKPTCNCNVGFTSGIVLDPFFGAGTTGLVALKQGKKFVGIELNKKYVEIAKKRLKTSLEQERL